MLPENTGGVELIGNYYMANLARLWRVSSGGKISLIGFNKSFGLWNCLRYFEIKIVLIRWADNIGFYLYPSHSNALSLVPNTL